eukprot:10380728-Ditylum_brightwellii.AAC.1
MENRKMGGKTRKVQQYKEVRLQVESGYTGDQIRSMDQASKCMNYWLIVVSCKANNSVLDKDEFQDMVLL